MKRAMILTSALAGALGATVWLGHGAGADTYEHSTAYDCHATGSAVDHSYGVANGSWSSDLVLRCNAPWTEGRFPGHVDELVVYGRDGSTVRAVGAQACSRERLVSGGTCGPVASSSSANVENITLNIDNGVWGGYNVWDFQYTAIRLPPIQGSSRSSVNGIRYHWDP